MTWNSWNIYIYIVQFEIRKTVIFSGWRQCPINRRFVFAAHWHHIIVSKNSRPTECEWGCLNFFFADFIYHVDLCAAWLFGAKRVCISLMRQRFIQFSKNTKCEIKQHLFDSIPSRTLDQRTRIGADVPIRWMMCTKHRPEISYCGTRTIDWHTSFRKCFCTKCGPISLEWLQNNASYFMYVSFGGRRFSFLKNLLPNTKH